MSEGMDWFMDIYGYWDVFDFVAYKGVEKIDFLGWMGMVYDGQFFYFVLGVVDGYMFRYNMKLVLKGDVVWEFFDIEEIFFVIIFGSIKGYVNGVFDG